MPAPSSTAARSLWMRRMQRYAQSSFSVAEFCRREDVSVQSFYYWKRKLDGSAPTPAFVPVEVQPLAAEATVALPGGSVVTLPAAGSREQLTRLIAAIVEATDTAADGAARR